MLDLAVNKEVIPSLIAVLVASFGVILIARLIAKSWSGPVLIGLNLAILGSAYMLYFFRDPERLTPDDPRYVVSGADGRVMSISHVMESKHLNTNAVRISVFLSLADVHVNRAPIPGAVTFAKYFPGARYFTFLEKSSEFNQHSEIVIENDQTRCLVNQIVGPIARRVVFWVVPGRSRTQAGQRIGMMKFGSRLDVYLPEDDIEKITVKENQKVRAGETILAVLKQKAPREIPAPAAPGAGQPLPSAELLQLISTNAPASATNTPAAGAPAP